MANNLIHRFILHFATIASIVLVAGCSSPVDTNDNSGDGASVRVGAEVARHIYTRSGYVDSGPVEEGVYYLTYPTSNANNVANVNFGVEGSSPSIGMVIVPPEPGSELKWNDIGGGSTPTFYLDNVNAEEYGSDGSTLTEIVFNENNPFVAGIFDLKSERPANDLLWGTTPASRGAKMVNFDLHHNMSRVRVKVSVDRTNEQEKGDLDLKDATVTISSLIHKPYSYNRLDGTMSLGEESSYKYEDLTLVGGETEYDWASEEDVDDKKSIYITHDFVLPPQGLREDDQRPVLTITLANGTKYSGILPHAMEIEPDDGGYGYPVALYFLKEHILTIRTEITETPPELKFMPVQVVQWVDKGDFTIEAHQSGIYTTAEFMKLIEYYNDYNEYQLVRYGKFNEGEDKWHFDFFHSVILNYEDIHGKMNTSGKKDFEFFFNNYKIFVKEGSETKQVSPEELYKIVTE